MHLCDRCKEIQKTCCQQNIIITLTREDVRRITQATGISDFFEFKYYPDLSCLDVYAYDPNWKKYAFLPGNLKRQIKMNSHGDCIFLGDAGCMLTEDARPLMCRLYPYEYNEYGMIGVVLSEDTICPVRLIKTGENLAEMLEMPFEPLNQWRIMYYDELRTEYEERENNPTSLAERSGEPGTPNKRREPA